MKHGLLALAIATLACGGTEIGNPPKPQSDGQLHMLLHSTNPGVSIGPSDAALQITEAWLKLAPITYARSDESVIGVIPIPSACNLLGSETCVPLHDFDAVDVCKVFLEFSSDVPVPDDAPAELAAAQVYFGGNLADGTPFVITGNFDARMQIFNSTKFTPTDYARLVLASDTNAYLSAIDLDPAEPGADGVIRVNETSYPEISALVVGRVQWGFGLYDDADQNGALSAEELTAPVATPGGT
jgi:hypothetical protein